MAYASATFFDKLYEHPVMGPVPFASPPGLDQYVKTYDDYLKDVHWHDLDVPLPELVYYDFCEAIIIEGGYFNFEEVYFTATWNDMFWQIWFGVEYDGTYAVNAVAKPRSREFNYRYSAYMASRYKDLVLTR